MTDTLEQLMQGLESGEIDTAKGRLTTVRPCWQ
jgi:hypothetical protein